MSALCGSSGPFCLLGAEEFVCGRTRSVDCCGDCRNSGGVSGAGLVVETQNAVKISENGFCRCVEIDDEGHHVQPGASLPVPSGRPRELEHGMDFHDEGASDGLQYV